MIDGVSLDWWLLSVSVAFLAGLYIGKREAARHAKGPSGLAPFLPPHRSAAVAPPRCPTCGLKAPPAYGCCRRCGDPLPGRG